MYYLLLVIPFMFYYSAMTKARHKHYHWLFNQSGYEMDHILKYSLRD